MTAVDAALLPPQRPGWTSRFRSQLRPVYEAVFGEPVREGRLEIRPLAPPQHLAATIGLIAVGALLGSLLFSEVWREGALLATGSVDDPRFLPSALFPVTLVALCIGWVLLLIGATFCGRGVQLFVAFSFLLVNGPIGRPLLISLRNDAGVRVGPHLVQIAFAAAPAILVVQAAIGRGRLGRRVRPFAISAMCLATAVMFGGLIWMQRTGVQIGREDDLPNLVSGAVLELTNLLLPLVFIAQLALIEFSYSVSTAVAGTFRAASLRVARIALVALVVGKLWLQVGRHLGDWTAYIAQRGPSVVRTLLSLGLAVALAAVVRRRVRAEEKEPTEALLYVTSVASAMPLLVASVLLTVPPVAALHLGRLYFSTTLASIAEWASDHGDFVIAGVGLAVTLLALLAARGRRSRRLTLGLAALAVIAAWACIGYALDAVWVDPGIRYSLFDVLVTVGVGGLLAMRWSRLDTGEVTRLGALVLFVWLVSTKGDVFSIVGGLLTVPAIGLVVLGVLLTLLTDSAFTRRDSSALPRGGRTLLWIGFLVLNLAILNWVQVTHGENFSGNAADRIFYYVGVPLAMWMAASRQFRDGEAEAPEPAAEPAS